MYKGWVAQVSCIASITPTVMSVTIRQPILTDSLHKIRATKSLRMGSVHVTSEDTLSALLEREGWMERGNQERGMERGNQERGMERGNQERERDGL